MDDDKIGGERLRKLPYTDKEIADSYRRANNQRAQIRVLVELNGLQWPDDEYLIIDALERCGIQPKPSKRKRRYHTLPEEEAAKRLSLYNQGLSDREAAEILGIRRNAFANWRYYNNLPVKKEAPQE